MSIPSLILASSSRSRRELLSRLVKDFQAINPEVDERSFSATELTPELLAKRLALEKATVVARRFPGSVVIGSDQLVDLQDQVLGKPDTAETAVSQLMFMSGKEHRLLTAVCVLSSAGRIEYVNETRMQMRTLTHAEAIRYVARDSPLDCAGSYRIESLGIALFEQIMAEDFTAIMGLPLIRLAQILRELGFSVP